MACNKINYDREVTSIGAAVAAGTGVEMYKDFTAVNKFIKVTKSYHPNSKGAEKYQRIKPVYDEVYHSLVKVYGQLADI